MNASPSDRPVVPSKPQIRRKVFPVASSGPLFWEGYMPYDLMQFLAETESFLLASNAPQDIFREYEELRSTLSADIHTAKPGEAMIFRMVKNDGSLSSIAPFPNIDGLVKRTIRLIDRVRVLSMRSSKNKRKPPTYDAATRTYSFNRKRFPLSRESDFGSLCDSFYTLCPTSGKVHWRELRDHMLQSRPLWSGLDREKIRELIRSLNRWAEIESLSVGRVLKLADEHVTRSL